jgi:hypothetical protein
LLLLLFQSEGTVQDVPDVRKIICVCPGVVTVMDAVQLVLPPVPVAVAVYVVSLVGDTDTVPWPTGVLLPMPLSILTLDALVVSQVSVADPPDVMDCGDTESVQVGGGGVTVTLAVQVLEPPRPFTMAV